MDRDKAKLILGSFRPDGADAGSPDFTEALQLAVEDRELGSWLAHERAQDGFFAECLTQVEIPASLRDDILATIGGEKARVHGDDAIEVAFADGLSGIEVPSQLRDQILTAMAVEQEAGQPKESKYIWPVLTSIAAAVAVAVLVLFNQNSPSRGTGENLLVQNEVKPLVEKIPAKAVAQVAVNRMTVDLVHQVAAFDLQSLEHTFTNSEDAIGHLANDDLPTPQNIPEGLKCARFAGHKTMLLEGGEAVTLLGFDCPKLGLVYLAVMDIHNLSDPEELSTADSISLKNCNGCHQTKYNFLPWRDGDNVYFILTKAEKERMIDLF